MKPSDEVWEKVKLRMDSKLRAWKSKKFEDLAALTETVADGEDDIDAQTISYGVSCWLRDPGSVVLVVRASIQAGSMIGHDYELGFVVSRQGEVRAATDDEVRSLWQ